MLGISISTQIGCNKSTSSGTVIPANALLDEDGNPILDEDGNYILDET